MLPPLDPAVEAIVAAMPDLTLTTETLPTIRGLLAGATVEVLDGVERVEHVIDDATDVRVVVHRPAVPDRGRPGIVYLHGGGYVLGDSTMDAARLDRWCANLGCVAVSVEYRLAPEHPYPTPLEDCYAALTWTREHAEDLGIDTERLGIAGLSAGGGLAAALTLLARDRGEHPVAFQLLDSPMLDDRQVTPSSRADGLAVWTRDANAFGWRSYLGDLSGGADVAYHAAPARAEDLTGLPPTFVMVGGVDGFRDEDVDYALRLSRAGVPTELHVYPGAPHGFGLFPDLHAARQAARDVDDWLERQFAA